MQSTDQMCVVVQTIGCGLGFVVVLAMVAGGRLLFGSLPDDAELLMGVLDNLLQSLLKIHLGPSPFVWVSRTPGPL